MTYTLEWVHGASVTLDVQMRNKGAGARPWLQYVPPFVRTVRTPPKELPATLQEIDGVVRPGVEQFIHGYTPGQRSRNGVQTLTPAEPARASLESLGTTLAAHLCFEHVKSELATMGATGVFLYIGTDEELLHYPIELLFDDTEFLCLKHHIGRYINASDAGTNQRTTSVVPGVEIEQLNVLLITVPEPASRDGASFEALPEADTEREAVDQVLRSAGAHVTDLQGRAARCSDVLDALKSRYYHLIHFSGHASFGRHERRSASLCLFDADLSVGVLSGALQRQNSAVLCFINGCETARGSAESDEESESEWDQQFNLYGLAKPFLDTGAYFLGTRWRIQDESARSFASAFYEEFLLRNTPVGKAITLARRSTETAADADDPSWASYVFYGDPRLSLMRKEVVIEPSTPPALEPESPDEVADQSVDPLAELADIAAEYEEVRTAEPSGPARTRLLAELMRRASRVGRSLEGFPFELWHAGSDGQRLVALSVVTRNRVALNYDLMLDSVTNARSEFEQYQALDKLRDLHESLPAEAIPQVLTVLRRASEDPPVTGTDRGYLIDDLLGKLSPQPEAGEDTKFWEREPGSTLKVAFLNGDDDDQAAIATIAAEWTENTGLRLEFGATPDEAEIRVRLGRDGSWSFLGTDALAVPRETETMSVATVDRPEVLRMFGHALGLINEHQVTESIVPFDRDKLIDYFGRPPNRWDRRTIEAQFLTPYERYYPFEKPFDPDSVMLLNFPDEVLQEPLGLTPNTHLSEGDKELIRRLYPPGDS